MNLLIALVLLTSLTPVSASRAAVVSVGSTRARVVSLTFDAGADRGYAAAILRTLERNRIRATFGMTGRWASANPDLVRRMARDRDMLMNHTYDHRSFTGLSSQMAALSVRQRTWEITQTERLIRRLTGASTKPYFRPPYGDYDAATLTLLPGLGYRYSIMWTVDSWGWQHLSPANILRRCIQGTRPGAIVLMHVGIQSQDAAALQPLVNELRHRGYRFVTVRQLMTMH